MDTARHRIGVCMDSCAGGFGKIRPGYGDLYSGGRRLSDGWRDVYNRTKHGRGGKKRQLIIIKQNLIKTQIMS